MKPFDLKVLNYFLKVSFVLTLLTGCGKENTDRIPEINVYSPAINQVFNVSDTILVSGKVWDDKMLASIKVVLTDQSFQPVHKAFYLYPASNNFILDLHYPLDNLNLKGGKHFLQVRADDGFNFRNFYQEIYLVELPLYLKQVVVLTKPQGSVIHIHRINPDDEMEQIASVTGYFAASEISSEDRQLYIAGKNTLNLLAFDLTEKTIVWQKSTIQPFPMHSDNSLYFDEILLVSFNYDHIQGYNEGGSVVFNSSTQPTDAPARIFRTGNFVLADFQKKNTVPSFIKTMYFTTGAEKQRIQTSFKVVDFHTHTNNTLVITANNANNGLILSYKIDQNLLYTEKTLPQKINCSAAIDENHYLIGTDASLLQYHRGQNQLMELLAGQGAERLVYEHQTERVFIAKGNQVLVYQYPQMQYQKTFPFSDTILNLHLQYARKE
jgi:hypothetical protein